MLRGAALGLGAGGLVACGSDPRRAVVPMRTTVPDARLVALTEETALAVAGEGLDIERLQRFYARRGFEPVWPGRQAQAEKLLDAVLAAGDHGLDPERFGASQLEQRDALPPMRRELLLSNAFLAYTDALAFGSVPVDRRGDGEALTPEPIDVAATLDNAIRGGDPAAAIEALAPRTPEYRALREALREQRASGTFGGRAAAARLRALEVNLERQRWLPRTMPADRVWVNVADQSLVLYRRNRAVFTTRVVVGNDAPRNQSPEFYTKIEASFLNPPWVIPRDIVTAEILPILRRDPRYLERNDMFMRENGEVEQRPGPNAGLGVIMFDMPNRFDVYLHDTPDKHIFRLDNRRISHGCIRVQNPLEFAALLMDQSLDALNQDLAGGTTTRKVLPAPMPVFVTYQTAFADGEGAIAYRPDFYNRDAVIWRKMRGLPDEPPPAQVRRRPGPPRRARTA